MPSRLPPLSRSAPAASRQRHPGRWLAVLALVLGLHWLAAQWIGKVGWPANDTRAVHAPVQVALLTARPIAPQTAAPAKAQAAPPKTRTPPRQSAPPHTDARIFHTVNPRAEPHPAATGAAASTAANVAASAAAPVSSAASAATAASGTASTATTSASQDASGVGSAGAPTGDKFSVPPSGDLEYDTFFNGVQNQSGTIHWASDGRQYQMIVSLSLPFIGTYRYTSEGRIDAYGLAPEHYTEQRGHRGSDVTTFERATSPRQIHFSRTPQVLPLPDGAQDRFSMFMQLASLVRADPGRYTPGVTREFYVVDNDSGELWPIETIGNETVHTRGGDVPALHFMRLPRRAGDRRRIDVWLAPSLGWLPARLLQTEPNGTQIELLWRGQRPPPAAPASAVAAPAGPASAVAAPVGPASASPAPTAPALAVPAPSIPASPNAPANAPANITQPLQPQALQKP